MNPTEPIKKFNREAFKHAIGMIESSGGKYLTSKTSSAVGKYHFLWNLIKKNKSLKGYSMRQFVANPELQEKVMDMALDGKLEGYPNYIKYAKDLKKRYNSDLSEDKIAALTHFLGSGNVKKYLKNPSEFKVPGVNLTPEKYIEKYDRFAKEVLPPEEEKKNSFYTEESLSRFSDKRGVIDPEIYRQKIDNTQVLKTSVGPSVSVQDLMAPEIKNSLVDFNDLKYGGYTNTNEEGLVRFENGGTHKQNPLGGIPQGMGSNGKPNLVEEGETKWNDYIFSNSITLGGDIIGKRNKKTNVFKHGGPVDPPTNGKEDLIGPKVDSTLYLTKQNHPTMPYIKEQVSVPDVRNQFKNILSNEVDFKSMLNGLGSEAFEKRYNDPITRERMKAQTGLTDENIDNMIIKGLQAKKQIGGNLKGSKASYYDGVIKMSEEYKDNPAVETHERVHASNIDAAMGLPLMDVLGDAWKQEGRGFLKKHSPQTVRNLNQPHEAYGNFSEFREELGLKPGQQIDKKTLKRLVKKKGLEMYNFYRTFNEDNIIEALNTIALQGNDNPDNFLLS